MNKPLAILGGTVALGTVMAGGALFIQKNAPVDTLVVYDQNGQEQMVVLLGQGQDPDKIPVPQGWVAVKMQRATYDGYDSKEARERALVTDVESANPQVGAALQANINAEDAATLQAALDLQAAEATAAAADQLQ